MFSERGMAEREDATYTNGMMKDISRLFTDNRTRRHPGRPLE
jgi:hypothetical protein